MTAADVRDLPGRASQSNPTGSCLSLVLSAGDDFAPVHSSIPLDRSWLLHQLAAAAGCDPVALSPDVLIGRKVVAVLNRFVGRSGFEKTGIGRWVPKGPVHRQHGIGRHA